MDEKKQQPMEEQVKEESEKVIKQILEKGIKMENVDFLYKMVDIYKDISNVDYWEAKKEDIKMRYKGYGEGSYGAGGYGAGSYGKYEDNRYGRGSYSEGSFGRRGVKGTGRGRYRGEEMMEEMKFHYGNYSEGGQYGAEGQAMESLNNLMESAYEYFKELKENANSPEEIKMMEHYFKKMGQM